MHSSNLFQGLADSVSVVSPQEESLTITMKISIVTAAYNSADTIRHTIESVLAQTHQDFEYIVVDGASDDGTIDILRQYEDRFEGRMRWISEKDKGLYDAMNKGFFMATGEIVGILNSDDFFTSDNILEQVAAVMEDKSIDAVYGDIHYVSPDNLEHCVRYYSSRNFTPQRMRMGFIPAHPSFYCRREIYRKYGCFDTSYRVAADFELLLRLIYVHKINTQYIPLDFVTMRTGGLSNSGWKCHVNIMRDHRKALRAHHVPTNIFLLSSRYVFKIGEILSTRMKRTRHKG